MIAKITQTNFAIQLVTFATSIMIARALGPVGRGELALVLLYPQLIANIALFGVDRAIPIMAGANELTHPVRLIVKLVLTLSLPAVVVALFIIDWQITDDRLADLSRLYLLYIPAMQFFVIVVAMFNGVGDFVRFNRARLMFYLLNAIFVAAVWASATFSAPTLKVIVLAHLAAVFGVLSYCIWLLRSFTFRAPLVGRVPAGIFDVFALAIMFALPLALAQFNTLAYQILVEHWLGVQALGTFIIFITYTRLLSPIGTAVTSQVFRLGIVGSTGEIARISRLSLAVYILGIIPLFMLAPLLMPIIFGSQFMFDGPVIFALFLSALFCMLADSLAEYLNGHRKVLPDIVARLLYVMVLILLSMALVPDYGLFAIALSMAGADLTRWIWLVMRSASFTNHRFTEFLKVDRNEFVELLGAARLLLVSSYSRK